MSDYDRAFKLVKIGMDYNADHITAEQATDSALGAIATIRAECADRAVEAIGNIRPSQRSEWELVEKALRAAIEGGQDA